jgi:hypothetical protein
LLTAALLLTCAAAHAADPSGRWTGAIETPNGGLAIAVTLTAAADQWSGTIDIPAQGMKGHALADVLIEGTRLRFEIAGIPGEPTFDGELSASGEALAGSFQQGGQSLSFSLQRSPEGAAAVADLTLPAQPVPGEGAAGDWIGIIDAGAMDLRLVVRIRSGDGDTLSAKLESLDQGAILPVASIALRERTLTFAIPAVSASFEGTLNQDGSAIAGTWSQAGPVMPLTLHRMAE